MFCHTEFQRNLLANACCPNDDIEIFLPDVTRQVLAQVVEFLYSGIVKYDHHDNLTTILNVLITALGFSSEMTFGSVEGLAFEKDQQLDSQIAEMEPMESISDLSKYFIMDKSRKNINILK